MHPAGKANTISRRKERTPSCRVDSAKSQQHTRKTEINLSRPKHFRIFALGLKAEVDRMLNSGIGCCVPAHHPLLLEALRVP